MHLPHQLQVVRLAGIRSARLLLALAMVAGACTFVVVDRAEPAGAGTIEWLPDKIVITSDRLQSITVRATQTVTLHRNGDIDYRVDAHNGGTRKFFYTEAWIRVPDVGNLRIPLGLANSVHKQRIDRGAWESWPIEEFDALLAARWDDVARSTLHYSFYLQAYRTR